MGNLLPVREIEHKMIDPLVLAVSIEGLNAFSFS
jgi:hypothetical protein